MRTTHFMRKTLKTKRDTRRPACTPGSDTYEVQQEPCSKDRTCARLALYTVGIRYECPIPQFRKPVNPQSYTAINLQHPEPTSSTFDHKPVNHYRVFSILRPNPCPRSDLCVFSIEHCRGRRAEGSRKSFGLTIRLLLYSFYLRGRGPQ